MDIPEKIDNSETTTETTTSLPAGLNLAESQRNKEKYRKQIDAANDLIYDRLPEMTKVALDKAIKSQDTRLLMDFMNRALGKPVEVKEINTNEQMRRNIDVAKEQLKDVPLDDLTRQYNAEIKSGTEG